MKVLKRILLFLGIIGIVTPGCTYEMDKSQTKEDREERNIGKMGVLRGLVKTSENLLSGYALLNEANSPNYYLVNREGEVVHQWGGEWYSEHAYLTDEGHLVALVDDPDAPRFHGGGEAGRIMEYNWEGDLLWDFEYATDEYRIHHDMAILPNGNILAVSWEYKSREEVLAAGRDTAFTPQGGLWPTKIIEIKPLPPRDGDIVWEWHIWDHLVQDRNPELTNYGIPADHPELLDINASARPIKPMDSDTLLLRKRQKRIHRNQTEDSRWSDVYHVNAVFYNEKLDQIAFNSPNLGEFFIIDHSTTAEEAAGHTGGRWGKGGDFLYRWGNPQNYARGDSTNKRLFYQHDIRWIPDGYPGEGNMLIYNNANPGPPPDSLDYSSVLELRPPMDEEGRYILNDEQPFGPEDPEWIYVAPDTSSFFSPFISGAHRLSNGNTFITCGAPGRAFEVTPGGEIVWDYWNPYRGRITRSDGEPRKVDWGDAAWMTFRTTFIPADHPALRDRELVPLDPQPEPYIFDGEKDK